MVGVTSSSAWPPTPPPFCAVGVANSDLGDRTADGDSLGDWVEEEAPPPPDLGVKPAGVEVEVEVEETEWSAELAGDRRRSSAFCPVSPVTWVKLLVLDSTSSVVVVVLVVVLAPPAPPPDGDTSLLEKTTAPARGENQHGCEDIIV